MPWMLVFETSFLILSYWALFEQHMWLPGVVGIGFSLFGLAITLLVMRPSSTCLRRDTTWFEIVAMNCRYRYAWGDVDGFFLGKVGAAGVVGVQLNSSYQDQRAARAVAFQSEAVSKPVCTAEVRIPYPRRVI